MELDKYVLKALKTSQDDIKATAKRFNRKKKRKCEICGDVIVSIYKTQTVCNNPECRKIRHANEVREWQRQNKETWNAYQRQYRLRKKKGV